MIGSINAYTATQTGSVSESAGVRSSSVRKNATASPRSSADVASISQAARDLLAANKNADGFDYSAGSQRPTTANAATSKFGQNVYVSPDAWRKVVWRPPDHTGWNMANGLHIHQVQLVQRDVLYLLALGMQAETANATKSADTAVDPANMFQPKDDEALKELADLFTYRASLLPGQSDASTASTAPARTGLTSEQLDQLYQVAVDQRAQLYSISVSLGAWTRVETPAAQAHSAGGDARAPHAADAKSSASSKNHVTNGGRISHGAQHPSIDSHTMIRAEGASGTFPSLLKPLQDYLDAKRSHISAELSDYLTQNTIPAMPSSISYDADGEIQLPSDYLYAADFKQALQNKPTLARELHVVTALTSQLSEMIKNLPEQQDDGIAKSLNEMSADIEGHSGHLTVEQYFNDPVERARSNALSKALNEIGGLLAEHHRMFLTDQYRYLLLNSSHADTISMNFQKST